ncbi:MAG TPA: CheR family methyltransferase, partial [Polyangiaceae bacterium]|nr:CheR family methyltransferase [Polyangiaceae bacterium]
NHPYAKDRAATEPELQASRNSFNEILAILRTRTRNDFSGYKKPTLLRRIQRRMGLNHTAALSEYVKLLRQTSSEVTTLSDDLMIHVTGFFRDEEAWEALREKVILPLVAERNPQGSVRCWVSACSSGEEAYTLAMLLNEAAERLEKRLDIKIFATDMAERSLAHARNGVYPGGIEAEISPERLARFFDKEDAVYRIKKSLREQVVFAPQNILQDPPFSRIDICSCRNLLIYLEQDVQKHVLSLMHFGLRDGGYLFLGNSETVAGAEDMFEPVDKKWRIFRRVGPTRHGLFQLPPLTAGRAVDRAAQEHRPAFKASIPQLTNKVLLDRYTPAAVTVDREQRIVFFHGATDPFLTQPRGEPTRDLLAMTRESLRPAVRSALQKAASQGEPATARGGVVQTPEGRRRIYVTVASLDERLAPGHYLVSFEEHKEEPPAPLADVSGPADRAELEAELRRVREELQSTIDAFQATREEMKASDEEATSVNEELQSTNEELETSKEELQSLNEELTTVNAQLQAKIDELAATSSHLASLLSSTDIAVIFLDLEFHIRRFTPAVKDLLELIPSDSGRPISDLRKKFTDPDLLSDARAVLERLVPIEREVTSESGKTYVRRVLPYRTNDNRIDGVVLTFLDITERTRVEQALREAEERLSMALRAARCGTWVRDLEQGTVYWSPELCDLVGVPPERARPIPVNAARELLNIEGEAERSRLLEEKTAGRDPAWHEQMRVVHPTRGPLWLESRGTIVYNEEGRPLRIVGISSDITDRKHAEEELERNQRLFKRMVEATPDVVFIYDLDGRQATYVSSQGGRGGGGAGGRGGGGAGGG